jgi:hypothetical protein
MTQTTKPKRERKGKTLYADQFAITPARVAGRPPIYTDELADTICHRIANGESLRGICENEDMPDRATVMKWTVDLPDFSTKYAQARARQADVLAEETMHIADAEPDPARARVRVAARQWLAARIAPKKYGDRLELGGAGADGAILVHFQSGDEKLL